MKRGRFFRFRLTILFFYSEMTIIQILILIYCGAGSKLARQHVPNSNGIIKNVKMVSCNFYVSDLFAQ
jgi:hypothetical protein